MKEANTGNQISVAKKLVALQLKRFDRGIETMSHPGCASIFKK